MRGAGALEWSLKGAISVGLPGFIVAACGSPKPLTSDGGRFAHTVEVDRVAMADHGTRLVVKAQRFADIRLIQDDEVGGRAGSLLRRNSARQ
jgi:hypothetical protein